MSNELIPRPEHFSIQVDFTSAVQIAPDVFFYRRDPGLALNFLIHFSGVLVNRDGLEISVILGTASLGRIETKVYNELDIRRHGSFDGFVAYCEHVFQQKFYPLHETVPIPFLPPPFLEAPHDPEVPG